MIKKILLVIFSILIFRPIFGETSLKYFYKKNKILSLPWGVDNGYVGYQNSTAIALDKKENIYITDPGNKRIEVFTLKGDFVKSISSDGIGPPLEVDDDGDIFTNYSIQNKWTDNLLIIKKNGKRIKYNKNFKFKREQYTFSMFNEPLLLKKDIQKTIDPNNIKNNLEIILISSEKINRVLQKRGKSTISDTISLKLVKQKDNLKLAWRILGFDDDGNIYVLVGYEDKTTLMDESLKIYSINGNLITEIPLEIEPGLIPDHFRVDNQGNVFQLFNSQKGVSVYMWTKK